MADRHPANGSSTDPMHSSDAGDDAHGMLDRGEFEALGRCALPQTTNNVHCR